MFWHEVLIVNRSNEIIGAALIHEIAAHTKSSKFKNTNNAETSNGTNTNGNPKVRRLA
jgi:hypothetical protein